PTRRSSDLFDTVDVPDRGIADAAGVAVGEIERAQVAGLAGGGHFPASSQKALAIGAQAIEVAAVLHVDFDPGREALGREPVDRGQSTAVDIDIARGIGGAVVELPRTAIPRPTACDDGAVLQVDLHQCI